MHFWKSYGEWGFILKCVYTYRVQILDISLCAKMWKIVQYKLLCILFLKNCIYCTKEIRKNIFGPFQEIFHCYFFVLEAYESLIMRISSFHSFIFSMDEMAKKFIDTHSSEIRGLRAQLNALEKCFKICHISGIRKPM